MFIGSLLQERMNSFELSPEKLSNQSFVELDVIQNILGDNIEIEDVEDFDLSLICNTLHCDKEFFTKKTVRDRDLVLSTKNRGKDTPASIIVKARIQDFINDFIFVEKMLAK